MAEENLIISFLVLEGSKNLHLNNCDISLETSNISNQHFSMISMKGNQLDEINSNVNINDCSISFFSKGIRLIKSEGGIFPHAITITSTSFLGSKSNESEKILNVDALISAWKTEIKLIHVYIKLKFEIVTFLKIEKENNLIAHSLQLLIIFYNNPDKYLERFTNKVFIVEELNSVNFKIFIFAI